MKTLAITLCSLLVMVPAGAQQMAERPARSFFVPYAVTVNSPPSSAGESSSEVAHFDGPAPMANTPLPQRYPIRRRYPRFGPPYMAYPQPPGPPISTRAALIIATVVTGIIVTAVVKAQP